MNSCFLLLFSKMVKKKKTQYTLKALAICIQGVAPHSYLLRLQALIDVLLCDWLGYE